MWLSPHFRGVLTTALSGVPVPVTVATPVISPASCNFYPTTNVTISCATSGATIRYTLDGSEPTAESDAYSAPIAVSATTTVKARAFADGMNASAVASATYTLTEPVDPPDPPPSGDHAFYIGETGYDTWADVYAAAKNGDTIILGKDASFAVSGNKQLTINLAGHALEWESTGWMYGSLAFVDSVGGGELKLATGNRNVQGGTVDLSALAAAQLTGPGKFWTNGTTVLKSPGDMSFADSTAKIDMGSKPVGEQIVVQGVTYTWDGSSWESEGKSYPEWIDSTSQTLTDKYDAWAAKFNVGDPTAAQKDAYLLNCANTAEAIAAAKADFAVVSNAINADGTVDVGLPAAPVDGFNGTVSILGSETVNGTYHAVTAGTLIEALYRIPAASNDHFFKASLDL